MEARLLMLRNHMPSAGKARPYSNCLLLQSLGKKPHPIIAGPWNIVFVSCSPFYILPNICIKMMVNCSIVDVLSRLVIY